eukprot:Gb_23976 [translate_table: standard]
MEMVGIMAGSLRDEAVALLNSYKYNVDMAAKMEPLRRLKEILVHRDPSLLMEFVPYLMELQSERSSPIRKYLAQMIEEIGLKYLEHLPEMVPVLMSFLRDDTPAVARQAVTTGTKLFRNTLEHVALQGIYSGQVDNWLENSWNWMIKFKDAIYPIAFQPGTDGVRLLAAKFVETTILLFTPDPNGSSRPPPPQQSNDGKSRGFNISWIVGGHPVLDAGLLGQEASKNLGLLLDQLRLPDVTMLHSSMVIVLVNSLAAIAKARPALYGRVLPVLLGLGPSCEAVKGGQVASVQLALKNVFLAFLKCTHPGAMPWRDRLVGALQAMNAGDLAEQALRQVDKMLRNTERTSCEPILEERTLGQASNILTVEAGRKRPLAQEIGAVLSDMDGTLEKRPRHTSMVPSTMASGQQFQENSASNGNSTGGLLVDTAMTPVQQLVAMFGALVAQGDRAVESLEILISRISPDLLAEVVIANMHNLPSTPPTPSDGDEAELPPTGLQSSVLGAIAQVMPPLMALSTALPQIAPQLTTSSLVPPPKSTVSSSEVHTSVSQHLPPDFQHDPRKDPHWLDLRQMPVTVAVSITSTNTEDTSVTPSISGDGLNTSKMPLSIVDNEGLIALSERDQEESCQNTIPGLDGPVSVVMMDTAEEAIDSFSGPLISMHPLSFSASDGTGILEVSLPGPTACEKSEPTIPGASSLEPVKSSSVASIPIVHGGPSPILAMVPPVVHLTEERRALLSRSAFDRIIEAYKQVASAGGCDLRLALLVRLVSQSDADYDIQGLLQKHILSDYQNYKGHELTLHVLYQLFGGMVSQQKETMLSSEASSIYENFLLTVAQTLRDSLPASDKSLSKLLGEVPFLPEAALKLLENLCYAGKTDKDGREVPSGDRVTQGLSAVWSLILLRPPTRVTCLHIALQSAVHSLEEVRTKAIRLVANKLYPLSYISQNIEEFATKMLLSVVDGLQIMNGMDIDESSIVENKDGNRQNLPNGGQKRREASGITGENSAENDQLSSIQNLTTVSITEAQRCMSLYFALCTKKHALLQQVFSVYRNAPKAVKQAVQRHIPILIRTIGSSSELLRIISDPPPGSENLLMQVLHILTDGTTPSTDLIATVKRLYETKLKDAGILIPVLSSLTKDEVLPIFPRLVDLPLEKFQAALARILQGSAHTGPALTPAEVLIAIHGIDPERDGIPLKKVTDACSTCFEQRAVFTQQVLAKVLNQLVEQTPLPLLFMRTVIQAIGAFPALVDFIMEILSRLVNKQIWRLPKLWVGFLKCAYQTQPHSFHVLLQLPAAQLENALNKNPALRAPLVSHANQPNIRSTLPRSTLVVLGIVQDTQPANSAVQNLQSNDAGPSGHTATETQASESAAGS